MKAKGPVDDQSGLAGQPIKRRRRSGFRPALRAKFLKGIRGDESLADQFSGLLLREMNRLHITEAELARKCGCSRENIGQILDGGNRLRLYTAEKLCRSIGLRIVISLKEEPPTEVV